MYKSAHKHQCIIKRTINTFRCLEILHASLQPHELYYVTPTFSKNYVHMHTMTITLRQFTAICLVQKQHTISVLDTTRRPSQLSLALAGQPSPLPIVLPWTPAAVVCVYSLACWGRFSCRVCIYTLTSSPA